MIAREETSHVTIALIAANCLLFMLAELFGGSTMSSSVLIEWGGAYTPYIREGAYWRLFTSMFMHSGIRHLLNNMLLLYVLGQHLEFLLGKVRYALLYLLGGLGGNIVAYVGYERKAMDIVSVGASGAVYAVIGGLIWIIARNKGQVDGLTMRQMMIMLAFSLYFGFAAADVSNAAHIGGLICGFLLSILLYRRPAPTGPDGEAAFGDERLP